MVAMTNSKTEYEKLRQALNAIDPSEAHAWAIAIMHRELGLNFTEILSGKNVAAIDYSHYVERLATGEPLQYILGEAFFLGRRFYVNSNVLIPRPETELLVEHVIRQQPKRVLDVGTGSGCIAISIQLALPDSHVVGVDVMPGAIAVAKKNAMDLNAKVEFLQSDFLAIEFTLPSVDLIVSNPPYIPQREKKSLSRSVQHEPHVALFVPDNDPLLFYKALARKSMQLLSKDGSIAVEVHEAFAHQVKDVFAAHDLHDVTIIKDLDQKDRIVTARR